MAKVPREEVERWALDEAGHLALKELAYGMPDLASTGKTDVVAWLMEYRYTVLAKAYGFSVRPDVHVAEVQYNTKRGGFIFVCRCGAVSPEGHHRRSVAKAEADAHLEQHQPR